MKAVVNRQTCIGCTLCASICPEVFEMDDQDLAKTIVDEISANLEDSAKEAADSCPVDAITIE